MTSDQQKELETVKQQYVHKAAAIGDGEAQINRLRKFINETHAEMEMLNKKALEIHAAIQATPKAVPDAQG